MRKKESRSKVASRYNLFGQPPLIEGEDEAAYNELMLRVSTAVRPGDVIEEIWARDIVDVVWNMLRLRRVRAAFLSSKVWNRANDEATSLADADPELWDGTDQEKEEMARLRGNSDPELNWEAVMAQNPRANKKFQKFWRSAWSTLDMDEIQARVMVGELEKIEQIEQLIMIEQRRFDAVNREIDRHRAAQTQRDNLQDVEEAEFETIKRKTIVPKISNKKVA